MDATGFDARAWRRPSRRRSTPFDPPLSVRWPKSRCRRCGSITTPGLEYGRNTQPEYGLYYVGVAEAQRQFIALARALDPPAARMGELSRGCDRWLPRSPPCSAICLSLYQPPASVDRHREFIVASSALKEARQYNAEGWRHAALLRFLQGTQRTAMIQRSAADRDTGAIARQVASFRARLDDRRVDHSIGLLLVERAEAGLEAKTGRGRPHSGRRRARRIAAVLRGD